MNEANRVGIPENMAFGRKLEKAMNKRGVKNYVLADELAISRSSLSKYVYGICVPRVDVFARMIRELKLTSEEIADMLAVFMEKSEWQTRM